MWASMIRSVKICTAVDESDMAASKALKTNKLAELIVWPSPKTTWVEGKPRRNEELSSMSSILYSNLAFGSFHVGGQ